MGTELLTALLTVGAYLVCGVPFGLFVARAMSRRRAHHGLR